MRIRNDRIFDTMVYGCILLTTGVVFGQEAPSGARATPLTRPELKRFIEDVKVRVPRIPLPTLTEQDKEKLGDQVDSYESRVKYHYLNGIEPIRSVPVTALANASNGKPVNLSREQDPTFTLDNAFKIELFWIVSRVNNCQYCIGHQETKLLGAGRTEDQIAALDGDWSEFGAAEKLAFSFARKFTYQPYLLSDNDIVGLKEHYTDNQLLEMILSMSGNNSINRWKEAIGVPQRRDEGGYSRLATFGPDGQPVTPDPKLPRGSYRTPTSPGFEKKVSRVAVFSIGEKPAASSCATLSKRPPLESQEFVMTKLMECRKRTSRLSLVEDAKSRKDIPGCAVLDGALPNWVRLIANFPKAGSSRFESIRSAEENGDISPLLKAQLNWILARQDRAWYALGQAQSQLRKLGQSENQIWSLDGDWAAFSGREKALFQIAKHLGTSPVVLSDADVKEALDLAGPRDVVQTISYTTSRASFNRLTESAGLRLDE